MKIEAHAVLAVVLTFLAKLLATLNEWAVTHLPLLYAIAIIVSIGSTIYSTVKSKKKK